LALLGAVHQKKKRLATWAIWVPRDRALTYPDGCGPTFHFLNRDITKDQRKTPATSKILAMLTSYHQSAICTGSMDF
jgi:hypothetical protein